MPGTHLGPTAVSDSSPLFKMLSHNSFRTVPNGVECVYHTRKRRKNGCEIDTKEYPKSGPHSCYVLRKFLARLRRQTTGGNCSSLGGLYVASPLESIGGSRREGLPSQPIFRLKYCFELCYKSLHMFPSANPGSHQRYGYAYVCARI
jgi:hypothetical protein